jgi:hypothetical protein
MIIFRAELAQLSARFYNSLAESHEDPLTFVPNPEVPGPVPVIFPATGCDLIKNLSNTDALTLLLYYSLPPGPNNNT